MRTRAHYPIDFAVTIGSDQGRTVVTVGGEVDVAAAPFLRWALVAAQRVAGVDAANQPVVVDLAATTFLDACGTGVLVSAARGARRAGSDVILRNPSRPVVRVLELTGLLPVFRSEWTANSGSLLQTLSDVA